MVAGEADEDVFDHGEELLCQLATEHLRLCPKASHLLDRSGNNLQLQQQQSNLHTQSQPYILQLVLLVNHSPSACKLDINLNLDQNLATSNNTAMTNKLPVAPKSMGACESSSIVLPAKSCRAYITLSVLAKATAPAAFVLLVRAKRAERKEDGVSVEDEVEVETSMPPLCQARLVSSRLVWFLTCYFTKPYPPSLS